MQLNFLVTEKGITVYTKFVSCLLQNFKKFHSAPEMQLPSTSLYFGGAVSGVTFRALQKRDLLDLLHSKCSASPTPGTLFYNAFYFTKTAV